MTEPAPAAAETAPVAAPPPAAAAAPPAPWYGDKIDPATIGFWQNKGIKADDPIAVAQKLSEMYRSAEGRLGAPPEELLRIPKSNAAEADINAYWQRIGVPAEAKDYDLSAVKFSDGKELEPGFADMLRGAFHQGRVTKERASEVAKALIKHMEDNDKSELATRTSITNEETARLDKNWGVNKTYFLERARRTLEEVGKVAGLTAEQTRAGWDAISSGGHIGASYAMEMLNTIGQRMTEAPFVSAQAGSGAGPALMSKQQAVAEIESLKSDRSFYEKLVVRKEVEAKRRWDDLHKIAYAA